MHNVQRQTTSAIQVVGTFPSQIQDDFRSESIKIAPEDEAAIREANENAFNKLLNEQSNHVSAATHISADLDQSLLDDFASISALADKNFDKVLEESKEKGSPQRPTIIRDFSDAALTDSKETSKGGSNANVLKPRTSDLDLNLIGSRGFNCLHAACDSGNIEMAKYLIEKRGVNPNIRGKDNWSSLEIAV